jgi:predicted nucleic acid-binding protein
MPPWRLVLDTNVWLDWLVFDDAEIAPLRTAVHAGRARVFIDAAALAELARVLGYRLRGTVLERHERETRLEHCRRIAHLPDPAAVRGAAGTPALPACADPDDQGFLALARDARAHCLITRDRALLALDRRGLPFRCATPAQSVDILKIQ